MRLLFRRLTPYRVCLIMAGALAAFGLIASPLNELAPGLWRILMARGLLITDFIALGGLGAASMNAAISASASVMLLILGSLTPEIEKKQRKKRRGLIFLSNCSHYSCTMYHNVL